MSRLCFLLAAALCVAHANPVIMLLTKLEDEGTKTKKAIKDNQLVFDKYECWAQNSIEDASNNINKANDAIKAETSNKASANGAAAKADVELKNANRDRVDAENKKADNRAEKEKASVAYNQQSNDLKKMIMGLNNAITVLKKHQGGFMQVQGNLKDIINQNLVSVSVEDQQTLDDFFNKQSLVQVPADRDDYESQSGAIFGILTNMLDNGKRDLKALEANNEEEESNRQALESQLDKEIAAAQNSMENAQATISEQKSKANEAAENLEEAEEQLATNRVTKTEVEKALQDETNRWNGNKKDMNDQLNAINEAVAILDDDTMLNAGDKVFLQVGRRGPLAAMMQAQAGNAAFQAVYKAIDEHIAGIRQQMKDDAAQKNYCEDLKKTTDAAMAANAVDQDTATGQINNLESQIDTLTSSIDEKDDAVTKAKKERAKAQENHDEETALRTSERAELENAMPIIMKARGVLAAKFATSLLQQQPKTQTRQAGGAQILAIVDNIVAQMEHEIRKSKKDQENADADHAETVADLNKSRRAATDAKGVAERQMADANGDLNDAQEVLDGLSNDKEVLVMQNNTVAKDCTDTYLSADWVSTRLNNQRSEIDALKQAKVTLAAAGSL